MRMPVMDGYEATLEIRERIKRREEEQQRDAGKTTPHPELRSVKIVALTASITDTEKRSFALLVGCDDLIGKPFRKTEIFDALNKHLGVSYTYSGSRGEIVSLSNSTSNVIIANASKLSPEWTEKMKQAIRSADFDLIATRIEEIKSENPAFARLLQGYLDNFDYPKILNLMSEAAQSNP